MKTLCLALLTALVLSAGSARANVIPLGIDWRKQIFVQEIYKDGVPHYLIANLGKDEVTISVFEKRTDTVLAGPWKIPGKSVVVKEVKDLIGKEMVTFKLANGTALGLIIAPSDEKPSKTAIVSYYGLNGSGGKQVNQWIEQPSEIVKGGEVLELTLKVPANVGTIRFGPQPENENIRSLFPYEVVSKSLPVDTKDKTFEIDTQKPLKEEALHTVTLRFRVPETDTPTMYMVNGQQRLPNGGGMGLTRGIVVSPAKGK